VGRLGNPLLKKTCAPQNFARGGADILTRPETERASAQP
jgi:hypothetical protein